MAGFRKESDGRAVHPTNEPAASSAAAQTSQNVRFSIRTVASGELADGFKAGADGLALGAVADMDECAAWVDDKALSTSMHPPSDAKAIAAIEKQTKRVMTSP
jgi:hypothetical protein